MLNIEPLLNLAPVSPLLCMHDDEMFYNAVCGLLFQVRGNLKKKDLHKDEEIPEFNFKTALCLLCWKERNLKDILAFVDFVVFRLT